MVLGAQPSDFNRLVIVIVMRSDFPLSTDLARLLDEATASDEVGHNAIGPSIRALFPDVKYGIAARSKFAASSHQ
jgi:hypothetical protein